MRGGKLRHGAAESWRQPRKQDPPCVFRPLGRLLPWPAHLMDLLLLRVTSEPAAEATVTVWQRQGPPRQPTVSAVDVASAGPWTWLGRCSWGASLTCPKTSRCGIGSLWAACGTCPSTAGTWTWPALSPTTAPGQVRRGRRGAAVARWGGPPHFLGTEIVGPAARGPGVPPLWRACRPPRRMIPGPQVARPAGSLGPGPRPLDMGIPQRLGSQVPMAQRGPGPPAASPAVSTGHVSLPRGSVLGDTSRSPTPPPRGSLLCLPL